MPYIIPIPQLEKCESATRCDDKFIQQNNFHKFVNNSLRHFEKI